MSLGRAHDRNGKARGCALPLVLVVLCLPLCGHALDLANGGASGGGPPAQPQSDCISALERAQVEANIARRFPFLSSRNSRDYGTAKPYPFVPLAGTEWQDRFVNNFVDLNSSSPGILDWDCSDFTYDGHAGHDIDLRSFGEQDAGSPVFAALDGTVADAHDGEFDRNTVAQGQPANYVILYHGGTQYTWYWHLRSNSVAVTIGQFVRAGTQIGLAASSGNSTGPHLHFESRLSGTWFEPSAGACRSGGSGWVSQIPIRRDMYLEDFAIHNTNSFPSTNFFPYNPYRCGTIVRSGTFQPIGAWYILHNQPANSFWRVRYLRPNATVFYDSGNQSYGNSSFYRYAIWWVYYNLNPDTAGTWNLELSINSTVMATAPFTVLNSGGVPTNRAPGSVSAAFDPPLPATNNVVFCRLTVPLLIDADYDLVRFRFQWRTNGTLLRNVTNAAYSDAIPSVGSTTNPILLSCTVTPFDGAAFGPSNTTQTVVGPAPRLKAVRLPPNQLALRWPTSGVPYALEAASNFPAAVWAPVTNSVAQSFGDNVTTVNTTAGTRYFRLRWP